MDTIKELLKKQRVECCKAFLAVHKRAGHISSYEARLCLLNAPVPEYKGEDISCGIKAVQLILDYQRALDKIAQSGELFNTHKNISIHKRNNRQAFDAHEKIINFDFNG